MKESRQMANSIELATLDWRCRHVTQADRLLDFFFLRVCVCACARDASQQLVRKSTLGGSAKKKCARVGVGVGGAERHLSPARRFPRPLRLRPGLRRVWYMQVQDQTPTRVTGTLTLRAYITTPGSRGEKTAAPPSHSTSSRSPSEQRRTGDALSL